jgi:transposase
VARVYINALYYTGKPTKAVADEWMVAKSTAAKWVRKARDLKLLGETRRGKSGGIRPEKEEEE